MNPIGTRIKTRRTYLGISQTELAQRVNDNFRYERAGQVHQSTVNKIEAGSRKLIAAEVPAFCEALSLTADELLGIREVMDDGVLVQHERDAVLGRALRRLVEEQASTNVASRTSSSAGTGE